MNIAIYGAGSFGEKVIEFIDGLIDYNILFVCDSDKKKWGTIYKGRNVVSPERIYEENELQAVFIAIKKENSIVNEILSKRRIIIYTELKELAVEEVFWDVSGMCNAKCKYCVTGRYKVNNRNSYTSCSAFKKIYKHLLDSGIISRKTMISLYNWKEPFLNPELINILDYCSEEGQRYSLSSNASVVRKADKKYTYSLCESIYFSMPGFSQASYDRIHGFDFEKIKDNISVIIEDMKEHGFVGNAYISAHKYQFSEREVEVLKDWAKKMGLLVVAYYPYLAGISLIKEYLDDKLTMAERSEIELDMNYKWKKYENVKADIYHPICERLTLDEKANITLCCLSDEYSDDYTCWGNIYDIHSYHELSKLREKMIRCDTCNYCRQNNVINNILN